MTSERIPQHPESYWMETLDLPEFDSLKDDISVDVAIVGGGITGVTAGYLLTQEGLSVALVDAGRLLNGTTGHTTAKITAQHSLIYDELIQHAGKNKARLYYEANHEALDFMRKTTADLRINCDWQDEDAVVYATTERYAEKLEKEYRAYQALNVAGELGDRIPFDNIKIERALKMTRQAQFHPVKYLQRLVRAMLDKGAKIYENTTAVDVEKGHKPAVITREGFRVKCRYVLSCSHFPFYEWQGLYFTRMYAERAYVIAAKASKPYPGGMYISAESPTQSLRSVKINGEDMVLVVGENHKTGQGKDTLEHYQALESFGRDTLGISEPIYRWSAQDLYTLDKIPYIGELTSAYPEVLVATGYKKWGMTTGTAAALLLRDIVLDRDNRFRSLFAPSRFYADPSLKKFLLINGDVAKHLIQGKFDRPDRAPDELSNGEGAVVTVHGKRAGAYKDDDGKLFLVDTTCTHMGCELEWNHGDRTWECPCHGSRFSYDGEIVEGPAEKPLKRLEREEEGGQRDA
ncbi:FAD-dependent oxidoreductase [Camelliibacillus cellulosilyticus]|uniref:FAD-dependent oxidoreductase n=1 Tax=Camelliibacillus cellulosilyticus TaxID=2174486 RepID=A0ABV9GJJ9_9BACL